MGQGASPGQCDLRGKAESSAAGPGGQAGLELPGQAGMVAVRAALAVRLVLLMTLMPGSCYAEAIAVLLGDLPLVPWHRRYQVPTDAVACTWRDAAGPAPLEQLRDRVLAGIDAEHHREDSLRAVTVASLDVGSIDSSLIRVPDTPANPGKYRSPRPTAPSSTPPGPARPPPACRPPSPPPTGPASSMP
jgi:hypothetical protein